MSIPYTKLPRKFQAEARAYIEHGVKPGQFLELLIVKAVTAMQCAAIVDVVSVHEMLAAMRFFDNHVPPDCWGSESKVCDWMAARTAERSEKGGKT